MSRITDDFIRIAAINLEKIKATPTESLHRRDFVFDLKNGISVDVIIRFLEVHDFIETEREPDVYFLTPTTYDISDFELALWQCVPAEAREDEPAFEEEKQDLRSEEELLQVQEEFERREGDRRTGRYTVVIILVLVFSWMLYQRKQQAPNVNFFQEHLDPEFIKNLK